MPRMTVIVEDSEDGGINMRVENPPSVEDLATDLSPARLLVMGILLGFKENGLAELREKVDEKFKTLD